MAVTGKVVPVTGLLKLSACTFANKLFRSAATGEGAGVNGTAVPADAATGMAEIKDGPELLVMTDGNAEDMLTAPKGLTAGDVVAGKILLNICRSARLACMMKLFKPYFKSARSCFIREMPVNENSN